MNQVTNTMLLAQATADVSKYLKSLMDFDAVKTEGRAFMAMAVGSLGLSEHEGRKAYDNGFPEMKEQLFAWADQKAQEETTAAAQEAQAEQSIHAVRLNELRKSHEATMQMLADRHATAIPEDADDDFVRLINSSHEDMVQAAERFHGDFMGIVQMKHRLTLEHCFTGHLVSEETAKKLVELYEVK